MKCSLLSLLVFTACIPVQTRTSASTSASTSPSPAAATSSSPVPAAASGTGDGAWFATASSATTGPTPAVAAQIAGEAWLDAAGAPLPAELAFAMRTQPASLATIKWGRPVIASCNDHWYLLVARSIDTAAGTIEVGRDGNEVCPVNLPIANVRVIVEFKDR